MEDGANISGVQTYFEEMLLASPEQFYFLGMKFWSYFEIQSSLARVVFLSVFSMREAPQLYREARLQSV